MKNTKTILLLLVLFIGIYSCKKDYPKDIPDWLKDKIKELKKETKGYSNCRYDLCMNIDEYTDGSDIIYWFMPGATPVGYQVFTYDGNYQCVFETIIPDTCGNIYTLKDYYFVRRIWKE